MFLIQTEQPRVFALVEEPSAPTVMIPELNNFSHRILVIAFKTIMRLIRIRCRVLIFYPYNTPWDFLSKVC